MYFRSGCVAALGISIAVMEVSIISLTYIGICWNSSVFWQILQDVLVSAAK